MTISDFFFTLIIQYCFYRICYKVMFNYRILKRSPSYESDSIFTLINLDIILVHGLSQQLVIFG